MEEETFYFEKFAFIISHQTEVKKKKNEKKKDMQNDFLRMENQAGKILLLKPRMI